MLQWTGIINIWYYGDFHSKKHFFRKLFYMTLNNGVNNVCVKNLPNLDICHVDIDIYI